MLLTEEINHILHSEPQQTTSSANVVADINK